MTAGDIIALLGLLIMVIAAVVKVPDYIKKVSAENESLKEDDSIMLLAKIEKIQKVLEAILEEIKKHSTPTKRMEDLEKEVKRLQEEFKNHLERGDKDR